MALPQTLPQINNRLFQIGTVETCYIAESTKLATSPDANYIDPQDKPIHTSQQRRLPATPLTMTRRVSTTAGPRGANKPRTRSRSRRLSRQGSTTAQDDSASTTPCKQRAMSTRSTSLPPSISKKSAPPQQDNGAQRKISGPANSVDQDPQDEVEGDDEEEMDLIEYSDEEDHQSSNKTPRQLDEEEMRRRVQTQWGCTPEEVIPTKLLEPKRHGEKLINSWLSFLCQIQTLGVDLKLARDEIENACDQNTVKYVGIEELEYAVVLAKEKRDAVTELGSDDDARRSSETEGAGTGILSRVRWDQEELDGDNDQSIDAPAQDGDSPAASDNDDPPKIDNRRLSKMKPKPKTNRTTMPSVSVGKKTKIDGVRPGDIEAGTSSEPPQAKDGEGQVDKNRVKTTEDRKRPSGDRELPGQSPKKISKKGQGKEATGGAGGGAGGPQPPAKKATQATAAASSTASNGIYRLVPNEQDRFAGRRIIWEELTQPERSRNETGFINLMRGNLPTCAQVKDERSMFRVCHTPDDLRDWFQHEKGLPQAGYRNLRGDPHYDRLPESILGNVTFALRLRHHIEGRKDIVTQADEAEDAFVTSVLDAYDTYTDTLEALGLYPVDRDGYKRTTEGEVRVSEANNETEDEAEPELAKPSKRKKSGKSKNSPGIGPSNAPGPEARHSSEEL